MKKILTAILIVLVAGGGVAFYVQHHRAAKSKPAPVVKTPAKTPPQPVKPPTVISTEPAVTNGYVIGVLSLSKSINGEEIKMKVTNDGSTPLQLSPDQQFRLVGLTSKMERVPLAGKTTKDFAGLLVPNGTLSGTVYFDAFTDEQSELHFYPDSNSLKYIVVPLITLPEGQ